MGTNYYAIKRKPKIVKYKYYERIHIGKSSAGWKFVFQDNDKFHSYDEFKQWLENSKNDYMLRDEYGNEINAEDLLKLIEEKQKESNTDDFRYDKNVNGYRFSEGEFS